MCEYPLYLRKHGRINRVFFFLETTGGNISAQNRYVNLINKRLDIFLLGFLLVFYSDKVSLKRLVYSKVSLRNKLS